MAKAKKTNTESPVAGLSVGVRPGDKITPAQVAQKKLDEKRVEDASK